METSKFSKFSAEFLGILVLVLMGCGSAVIAGADGTTGVGLLGISFAFGLSVVAMAYAIGHISGCHINPAISIGMVVAGRMKASEAAYYIAAQILGAIASAGLLYLIVSIQETFKMKEWALGSNGWGKGYLGEYNSTAAFNCRSSIYIYFLIGNFWLYIYQKY